MEAVIGAFVRRAVVSFGRGDTRSVDDPTWTDVEAMLRESNERGGRVDLQTDSDTEMTVFAEKNAFHVTISVDEIHFYFGSNGSEPTDETQDLFGHSFVRHQVINDISLTFEVAKTFWSTGERSERVRWLHEAIDV